MGPRQRALGGGGIVTISTALQSMRAFAESIAAGTLLLLPPRVLVVREKKCVDRGYATLRGVAVEEP